MSEPTRAQIKVDMQKLYKTVVDVVNQLLETIGVNTIAVMKTDIPDLIVGFVNPQRAMEVLGIDPTRDCNESGECIEVEPVEGLVLKVHVEEDGSMWAEVLRPLCLEVDYNKTDPAFASVFASNVITKLLQLALLLR